MTAITVLVVGCGAMGRIHGAALRRRGADLWCTDAAPDAAERYAAEVGATAVEDLASALERGVDAALVTTPAPTHASLVATLVAAGVPTFCEKPLSLTLEE
jgi:myo-inositol 2-dehydrogenase / D-chiro-inositol 1-dehydrogenase